MVKFSIIIPVKEINDYIRRFVPVILNQSYRDFEIIILPDENEIVPFRDKRVKIIKTGPAGPAQKRDIGAKKACGEILAFIDDDAYPEDNWLKNSLKSFKNKENLGVGGPNLTPEESNFFQKVSGEVLASWIISGPVTYRYKKSKKRELEDFPSCNLFIRKKDFLKAKGFDTNFWPGEDTKLCLDVRKNGGKIVYDPEVVVYHHRRKDLNGYLKQIFSYALHRGHFTKEYPETSLKLSYFMPALFFLGIIIGSILALFSSWIAILYVAILLFYLLLLIFSAIKTKSPIMFFPFIAISFLTHITYGIGFIIGLIKKDLKSKYR